MEPTSLLLLFSLFLFTAYCYYRASKRRMEFLIDQFPGPYSYPVIGNVLEVVKCKKDIFQRLLEGSRIYSSPARIWLFNKAIIFIHDPENFQVVLNKTFRKGHLHGFIKQLMGNGLITVDDKHTWRMHRRLLNPAFNLQSTLTHYLKIFIESDSHLLDDFDKLADSGRNINIWPFVYRNEYLKVAKALLNYDFSVDDNDDEELKFDNYYQALKICYRAVLGRVLNPILHHDLINDIYSYITGKDKTLDQVHHFPQQVMRKHYNHQQKKNTPIMDTAVDNDTHRSFIDLLLSQEGRENYVDERDLSNEIITTLEASSTTIPTTICFTLLMLAMHQDYQDLIRTEINQVFGKSEELDAQKIDQLTHLERCLKETLRLFPPAPFIVRNSDEDIKLKDGRIIPAGSEIVLSIFSMHRNSRIYSNPDTWDPNRFTPEETNSRHLCSFAPFGAGPRMCMGYKYAYFSMKTQLVAIIRRFRFTTDLKLSDIELNFNVALMNATGHLINLYRVE